jgi:hypothetical protein
MPTISRWFIKAGLICFICGLLLSVITHSARLVSIFPVLSAFRPVYYHLLFMGWITEIIIGVSIWMFPRYSKAAPHGIGWVNWSILIALNLGLLLRCIAEPLVVVSSNAIWPWVLLLSSLLQFSAGGMYVGNIWQRVRGK